MVDTAVIRPVIGCPIGLIGAMVVSAVTLIAPYHALAMEGVGTGICINTAGEAEACSSGSGGGGYSAPSYRPPVYRPSPQDIQRQRRAAELEARHRRAVDLNDQAVHRTKDWERKLELYEQAVSLWPENKTFQENLAIAHAQIEEGEGSRLFDAKDYSGAIKHFERALGYHAPRGFLVNRYRFDIANTKAFMTYEKHGGREQAIAYWKEALKYDPENRATQGNIAYAEAKLAYDAHDLTRAISKMRDAIKYAPNEDRLDTLQSWQREADEEANERATKTRIGRSIGEILEGPGARNETNGGTVPGRQGTPAFGQQANPGGLTFMSPDESQIANPTAGAQADSANKSGSTAALANTGEEAKARAGCQFDRAGCTPGAPLPELGNSSGRTTRAAVFPNLADKDWARLQNVQRGRDLIHHADDLVSQQTSLKHEIDQIGASPNATQRQQELLDKVNTLDGVNKQIDGLQKQAQEIIDEVVLDPTPPDKRLPSASK